MWTPDQKEFVIPFVKSIPSVHAPMWKIVLTVDKDGRSSFDTMMRSRILESYVRNNPIPVLDHLFLSSPNPFSVAYRAVVEGLDAVACDLLPHKVSCFDLDTGNDQPVAMANRNLHTNAKKNRYPILHGETLLVLCGLPSYETAVLTKQNVLRYDGLPENCDKSIGRQHRFHATISATEHW